MRQLLLITLLVCSFFSCKDKDVCKSVYCENGGQCENGTCKCEPSYSGYYCELWQGQAYLGQYEGSYDCSQANLPVAIEAKPGSKGKLTLRNLGDYWCPEGNYLLTADLNGNSLRIPEQSVCNIKPYTFEGYGTKQGDTLRLHFTVRYFANPDYVKDSCNAIFVKKP